MSRIEKALKKAIEQQDLVRPVTPEPQGAAPVVLAESEAADAPTVSSVTTIGRMAQPERPLSLEERSARKIISPEFNQAAAVKAFRELRTKINQRVAPGAVIIVTGIEDGGGSSFVSLNLAAAIAFDSTRTALLIDCNLRDPAFSQLLGNSSVHGLTDYLEDPHAKVADIIHPTGIERLRVIPVGRKPDEHSEYFTLERMRRLIGDLAARYPDRQVILDVPPIANSADAQILAEFCDHILVVVPYGRVTEARVQNALKSIDAGKLMGVILNDEPTLPVIGWRGVMERLRSAFIKNFSRSKSAAPGATRQ